MAQPQEKVMCGSARNLGGLLLVCNRRYAHPYVQKHRALLEDLTLIIWDGAPSREIPPRLEEHLEEAVDSGA